MEILCQNKKRKKNCDGNKATDNQEIFFKIKTNLIEHNNLYTLSKKNKIRKKDASTIVQFPSTIRLITLVEQQHTTSPTLKGPSSLNSASFRPSQPHPVDSNPGHLRYPSPALLKLAAG